MTTGGVSSLAALCAVLALAGCGGSDNPKVSAKVVADAAAKTSEAGTGRMAEKITGSLNGKDLGTGSLHEIVDGRRRSAALDFDLSFLAGPTGQDVGLLKGQTDYIGDLAYVTGPTVAAKLPRGKRWVKLTRAQITAGGSSGGSLGVGALDATKPVDHLRAATGEAEDLGSENVNGAATKHYRTTVDYRQYLPLAAKDRREVVSAAVAKLDATLGTTQFPVEAWIASDGTLRRVKGTIEGHGLHLTYTLDMTAVGQPVHIRPPPAAQVLDGRKQ